MGLDPDGRDLVNVLTLILKDNAAPELIGKIIILVRIYDNGMRETDCDLSGRAVLRHTNIRNSFRHL